MYDCFVNRTTDFSPNVSSNQIRGRLLASSVVGWAVAGRVGSNQIEAIESIRHKQPQQARLLYDDARRANPC